MKKNTLNLLLTILIYKKDICYIQQKKGNIINVVKFLYYLFSFTPFLHNKTVVAIAAFFL